MVDLAGADFDDRDLGSSTTTTTTNSTTSTTSTSLTNSTTAQQRKESIDINKSLLALKECFRYDGKKIFKKSRNASGKMAIKYYVRKSRSSSGALGQRGRRLQELVSEAASLPGQIIYFMF